MKGGHWSLLLGLRGTAAAEERTRSDCMLAE